MSQGGDSVQGVVTASGRSSPKEGSLSREPEAATATTLGFLIQRFSGDLRLEPSPRPWLFSELPLWTTYECPLALDSGSSYSQHESDLLQLSGP